MTTTLVFSDAADGQIVSGAGTYAGAYNGTGSLTVDTSADSIRWGQSFNGSNYFASEAFLSFAYTVPSNERVISSYVRIRASSASNTSFSRDLYWSEFDWGASLTSADFRTRDQLVALPTLAITLDASSAGNLYYSSGSDALSTRLMSASPLRLVGSSSRLRVLNTPGVEEDQLISSTDASGTISDPALVFTSTPSSMLLGVLGAAVQLSGGRHIYLESSTADASSSMLLKYHDGTSASTVATLSGLSAGSNPGMQQFAVTVDSSDNIYVIASSGNSLAAQAFTKGGGFTWTPGTVRTGSMPSYSDAGINNVAAAWHNVGTAGTLMVVASHAVGRTQSNNDVSYALLNCNYLLTGSGSFMRDSGAARGTLVSGDGDASNFTNFVNATGNQLDVVAAPGTTNRGYVVCPLPYTNGFGDADTPSLFRYVLNSGGSALSDVDGGDGMITMGAQGFTTKDAGAKARVVGLSSTAFAYATADPTSGWGITVEFAQNFGNSSSFTLLGEVRLDAVNATMPTASGLSTSSAWDMIYDSVSNKIWVYYISSANGQTLMRTSIDANTYLASGDSVTVSASVGASGSSNLALRVHRGPLNGQQMLIAVANRSSGGTHTTQYVLDSFNQAPTAPTLTAKANYDATASATFAWTFNDPNAGDTQSAFRVQINSSSGVYRYDSAKIGATAALYVSSGAASAAVNASVTPPVPSGNIGDTLVMLASIRNSGTGTVNTPSGWQVMLTSGNVSVFAKVAEAASETAPTVSFSNGAASEDTIARVHRFRNLPLYVFASAAQLNGSAANVAYPALTVPLANGVILISAWKQDDWTSVATLSGYTEIDDTFTTTGNDAAQATDYLIQSSASSVASGSFTVTGGASAISRGLVVAMGPSGFTPTLSNFSLPASTLSNGNAWQWRVKTWDAAGLESPWSDFGTFSTSAGGNVTITAPASDNPAGVITDDYTVQWSVTGTTQAYYRVKVVRTSDSSVLSDTGFVASVATSAVISGMLSDVEYRIEVTVRNAGLVDSGTGTRLITPSYGSPDTPLMTLTTPADAGYILVAVDNPTPTGDRPVPSINYVYRRLSGTSDDFVAVGSMANDGTYRDYAVAAGVLYEYKVRAQA